MRSRLTDATVRALPLPPRGQRVVFDASLPTFGIRVSQGGTKTWVLVQSNPKRFVTVGRFPVVSLAKAREAAKTLMAEKTLGRLLPKRIAFNAAKDDYLAECAKRNKPSTVAEYTRLLKRFPFGTTALGDVTKRDILKRLNMPASEAFHATVALKVFFHWCVKRDYLDRNPCEGLEARSPNHPRERVLTDDELHDVLAQAALDAFPFGFIVQLLAMTGLRRANAAGLRWEYIDETERLISLPASVTKNNRRLIVPYGDMTAAVFEQVPRVGDYLFPASRSHVRSKPTTVFHGWSKAKRTFDQKLKDVAPYTLHDLRRTFASGLQRLGVRLEVIEQLLGHVSGSRAGVIGVYQRYDFLPEQRKAIEIWEHKLGTLMASDKPAETGA